VAVLKLIEARANAERTRVDPDARIVSDQKSRIAEIGRSFSDGSGKRWTETS
jgi:hypothetical protein